MSNSIILSAQYLAPISYYHAINQATGDIILDKHEHFIKQTFRSRTRIATANGILDLVVPVQHGRKERVAMSGIKINYDHEWQRLHWLSIQTAYRSSAYFEFYEDEFKVFYTEKYDSLFEFNLAQMKLILKILKINKEIKFSESYVSEYEQAIDYRNLIHPKKASVYPNQKRYYQIFEDRTGFLEDVSILDLIFNQGPQSRSFL